MARLAGIHPDLRSVILRAAEISDTQFIVLEGLRTVKRQKELVAKGASKTMNSRHLTGHAVDVAPILAGKVSWDWPLYHRLAAVIKQAARDVGVPVEWGGDWRKFKDGPHWQLPWSKYPKAKHLASSITAIKSGVYSDEINAHPEYTDETDTQAAAKSVGYATTGTVTGVGLGYDPAVIALDSITAQQYELSSGDIVRLVLAVGIIGLSIWLAFRKAKDGG